MSITKTQGGTTASTFPNAYPAARIPPMPATTSGDDRLVRQFLQKLLIDAGSNLNETHSGTHHATDKPGYLDFEEEDDAEPTSPVRLDTELATTAVRFARAFEMVPESIKAMRKQAPVVMIESLDPAIHPALLRCLKVCVLGRTAEIVTRRELDQPAFKRSAKRQAVIFDCTPDQVMKSEAKTDNSRFIRALQASMPVIGLTSDTSLLPPDFLRATDHRLVLPMLTAADIGLVIEAVTGALPSKPVPEQIACHVELSDLHLSVRADRSADDCVQFLSVFVRKRLDVSERAPRLEELTGYGRAKDIGLTIAADLKDYADGMIGWGSVDHGLLLAGPPGTGKTTFARALAKTTGLPLMIGSLAQWQASGEAHLGHLLRAMRRTFADAKAKAPCLLFIDELDSFGDRSQFDQRHKDYSTQVVNALLECLDGSASRAGIVVIGATNNPEAIDPAIRRAGRLDRTVLIELPDLESLKGIFRYHLGEDLEGVDLTPAAIAARGGSGADCEAWVRRVKGKARRQKQPLSLDDLLWEIRDGRPALPADLRHLVAIHEAGHAIIVAATGSAHLESLTITDWGGVTTTSADIRSLTATDILTDIVRSLGGREAERLVLGDVSAGAGGSVESDLAKATRLAMAYHGSFGLGDLGPLWIGDPEALQQAIPRNMLATAAARTLAHATSEAQRILRENRAPLMRLAEALEAATYLEADAARDAIGKIVRVEVQPLPLANGSD